MTIQTRDFGTLELDERSVVEFAIPIFGFEDFTHFVMLSDDEAGPELVWLQSLEDPEVCFILLDPGAIGMDYHPETPKDAAEQLGLTGVEPLVRVITVVPDDFKKTTVNLKSPILINPDSGKAAQVILDADWPIRMRLFGEEDASC